MKALKTSKGARKGGRPKKPKSGIVNVAPYMRFMKRVCSHKLVYDQLDNLEYDICTSCSYSEQDFFKDAIAQIKEDISKIKI